MARAAADMSSASGTRAFLFSDLRGYTAFVEARGDRAAAALLASYRDLVRAAIAAQEGAEIRTEGDSFYVVFPAASAAVEAGVAIINAAAEQSTPDQPIAVGVGIHAGETVATSEGLVGGAVNIAARVCAKAEAGEVLVTDTVRALTRTFLPYRYTSLGTQHLKGITGGLPLYRVELKPVTRAARLRRQLSARRGRVAAVVGLALISLAAAGGFVVANRGPDCLSLPAATRDVVARIDPGRNCVTATYEVGRDPSFVLWAGDSLWVANTGDRTLTALGPDGEQRAVVGVGSTIAIASDEGYVYVLNGGSGSLTTVELEAMTVAGPDELPSLGQAAPSSERERAKSILSDDAFREWSDQGIWAYRGLAAEPGWLWVSNLELGLVIRMPSDYEDTGAIYRNSSGGLDGPGAPKSYRVDPGGAGADPACLRFPNADNCGPMPFTSLLAPKGNEMWVAHKASPDLAVLELHSGHVTHVSPPGAVGGATSLAVVREQLWATFEGGQILRVGSRHGPFKVETVSSTLVGVAGDTTGIWAVSGPGHEAIRLDSETLRVQGRVDVGGRASGITVAPDGFVWVTIQERL